MQCFGGLATLFHPSINKPPSLPLSHIPPPSLPPPPPPPPLPPHPQHVQYNHMHYATKLPLTTYIHVQWDDQRINYNNNENNNKNHKNIKAYNRPASTGLHPERPSHYITKHPPLPKPIQTEPRSWSHSV